LPEVGILSQLTRWFAQEPVLCFGIVACVCAAIYGLFNLDKRGTGGDFSLFGDGDGGGDGGGD
jgi:hypothetical protein